MTQPRVKVCIFYYPGRSVLEEFDLHEYGSAALTGRRDANNHGNFTQFYRYVIKRNIGVPIYTLCSRYVGYTSIEALNLVAGPGGTLILPCGQKLIDAAKRRLKS